MAIENETSLYGPDLDQAYAIIDALHVKYPDLSREELIDVIARNEIVDVIASQLRKDTQ